MPRARLRFIRPPCVTDVAPASTLAQEEIFGPVLVAMSFRTPDEAVALANNSRYGLAASVWSETIGRALDIAPRLQCGVVWINATNLFDAGVGFGGYRESGFGREGGREGIYEYLKPRAWLKLRRSRRARCTSAIAQPSAFDADSNVSALDRTAKLFIGGKQVRPDSGYSLPVHAPIGAMVGEVGEGNRKDIRNAVEPLRAAQKSGRKPVRITAPRCCTTSPKTSSARADEFARQLVARTGVSARPRERKSKQRSRVSSPTRAWADKFDGAVHTPPLRGVALAMHEPLGVIGMACPDEAPLLGLRLAGGTGACAWAIAWSSCRARRVR